MIQFGMSDLGEQFYRIQCMDGGCTYIKTNCHEPHKLYIILLTDPFFVWHSPPGLSSLNTKKSHVVFLKGRGAAIAHTAEPILMVGLTMV